jgi:hypothetical protein
LSRACTVPLLPLTLLCAGVLVPIRAEAQGLRSRGGRDEGVAAAAEPGEEPLPPGEVRVKAESYAQTAKDHWEARGTVDLRMSGVRVLADKADVYEETRPDHTVRRRIVAEGNVVFIRGAERLSGDRAELDDQGKGFFVNAVGYVEPGVFIEARRIDRVDNRTYRVQDAVFSSCSQPNPRWNFTASRAKIHVDDRIQAANALFKVKGVPALYLPYIIYPIRKDRRSTGFLFPRFGYSSFRGFEFGSGFFWAMGRSADQTFFFDNYTKLGQGYGHELRWTGAPPSRGTIRTYVFDFYAPPSAAAAEDGTSAAPSRTLEYDLDWNALQLLPGGLRAAANVREASDLLRLRQLNADFAAASTRTEHWSASLDRDFPFFVLSAYAESNNTYFNQVDTETGIPYTTKNVSGRVPGLTLRRFPRQIGWGGIVFGLTASADRYRFGAENALSSQTPPPATWNRYDFAPTLSRPLRVSFLDVNPAVSWRYTRYTASNTVDEDGIARIDGPPVERRYVQTSLEVRGPTFSRVFDTPGFGYTERFKHTIGPEVTWTYISRIDSTPLIPKSTGDDYLVGTHEIRYALVQRFYAKRPGRSGKPQPYEFLSWRLMQTYYVQINEGQNAKDLNYSSSALGPGDAKEHLSPILSRVRFQPLPDTSLNYDLEYDVNFKQVRRSSLNLNVSRPGLLLTGSWSRVRLQSLNPSERFVGSEFLRAAATAAVWPRHVTLEGSTDYDLHRKVMQQARVQLRYSVQCCGLVVENIRYNLGGVTPETQIIDSRWRFSIELANVGSIGMGRSPYDTRQGLGGYR